MVGFEVPPEQLVVKGVFKVDFFVELCLEFGGWCSGLAGGLVKGEDDTRGARGGSELTGGGDGDEFLLFLGGLREWRSNGKEGWFCFRPFGGDGSVMCGK